MKPPAHLGGCVWTASHTFQCPGHSPAMGPWPGRTLSSEKGRISREENPQGKPVAGRTGLQRAGTRPQRAEGEERGGEEGSVGCRSSSGIGHGGGDRGQAWVRRRRGCLALNWQALVGRGYLWTLKPSNGCPSSTGFVGWTGMYFGSGAHSSQPILGKGEVIPHDHLCPLLLPSCSPVLQPQRTPETSFGHAPFLVPTPTPGHFPLPPISILPLPRLPPPILVIKAQVSGSGDGMAAGVSASAQNTISKAWVLPQP